MRTVFGNERKKTHTYMQRGVYAHVLQIGGGSVLCRMYIYIIYEVYIVSQCEVVGNKPKANVA